MIMSVLAPEYIEVKPEHIEGSDSRDEILDRKNDFIVLKIFCIQL